MKSHFDINFLEKSTDTLKAIAHPIRMAIVDLLHKRERMSVTEIYEQLNIEQAVASHHLRIMKDKHILSVSREGKSSIYFLSNPSFYNIIEVLIKVA